MKNQTVLVCGAVLRFSLRPLAMQYARGALKAKSADPLFSAWNHFTGVVSVSFLMASDRTDSPAPHSASPAAASSPALSPEQSTSQYGMSGWPGQEGTSRDDANRAETESNADSVLSQSTSSMADEEDSLIDATPAEVEARAMALITNDPATGQSTTADGGSDVVSLDPLDDLPRRMPPRTQSATSATSKSQMEAEQAAHANAIAFLRQSLERADETDWMYSTPAVFAAPKLPSVARGGGGGRGFDEGLDEGSLGYDGGAGATAAWLDQAFNLDAYGLEEMSVQEDVLGSEALFESEEHSMFADTEAVSF